MKIACLGWGSLIWDPRELKVQKKWRENGPKLPIELNRISKDKRVTFIIDEKGTQVNVLWALMTVKDKEDAVESLKKREETTSKNIHSVFTDDDSKMLSNVQLTVLTWLKLTDCDGAIWTGLYYKNNEGEENSMSYEYVKNHISSLNYAEAKLAERYIRKASIQIRTSYRKRLEIELGWTPI